MAPTKPRKARFQTDDLFLAVAAAIAGLTALLTDVTAGRYAALFAFGLLLIVFAVKVACEAFSTRRKQ